METETTLRPLAEKILKRLRNSYAVVSIDEIRQFTAEHNYGLGELNEAMRELREQDLAHYCYSCRSFISATTGHAGGCPHGV